MKRITPIRSIRRKCLECSNGSPLEVKECPIDDCPIYPYRLGKNPARTGIGNIKALLPKNTPLNTGVNHQGKGGNTDV